MATFEFQFGGLPSDAEIDRMFAIAPKLEHYKLADEVVKAAAAPVLARAIALAPDGTVSGNSRLRSKNQLAGKTKTTSGVYDWAYQLKRTIKLVVRKGQYASLAVIGPFWPKGNKVYYNVSPKGRRQVLWGNITGRIIPAIRNWIVQAFDETKSQSAAAAKAKATEIIDRMMKAK